MTRASTEAILKMTVNGEPHTGPATDLAALVASLGHEAASVATAVNGEFVPRSRRTATLLSPGDRVEIVSPRQGG